jgi:hypothetical protein
MFLFEKKLPLKIIGMKETCGFSSVQSLEVIAPILKQQQKG